MSEMVERVAKAIREAMDSEVPMEGDYHVMARAVIEAMREPTPEISQQSWCEGFAEDLWIQFIDAALK